ncbi:ATP-grasp domain-containing protein [Alkaliphilus serpentinus]|uniref:ATP-grasp domain-containing protein n=1 Tax=Alkaliphilus serpentinus TaxID=1482731 RepID=A0A833HLS4_9FIRM|nr:ATP-grasp domain-containing protein [Alkaliphilus serpentinus]KAB3526637.1 ATP-grasp domain-containing protein [Alkaliphilus serpentinus]
MKKRVLVFPCGSVPGIDINFALRDCLRIELFGGSSVADHGSFVYKNYIGDIPNINEECFIERFNQIIEYYKINFIIPTHDTVALFLMENQTLLNAIVVCSEVETTRICRHKALIYETFKGYDFNPIVYNNINTIDTYPVFLKPNMGQGGRNSYVAHDFEELNFYMHRSKDLIICEYLPGDEITIDCFTDKNSKLRYFSPRIRQQTFNGISSKSHILEKDEELLNIVRQINDKLSFRGYWFIQLKKDTNGNFKLLEISTRVAGTACLSRNLDVNFPYLAVLDFSNEEIDITPNNYSIEIDRTLISRYKIGIEYDRVYIDFDDTLVFNNSMYNKFMFMFIYQCLNNNKEIILITKHEKDIYMTLQELKIDKNIFKEIIHITNNDYKYKYLSQEKPCIFIDNSYVERKHVRENLDIPSFDLNNIECLIDWRG